MGHQISLLYLIELIWQFQKSPDQSHLPNPHDPSHLLVWASLRASRSPESIWGSGWLGESLSSGTDAAPPPHLPVATDPSLPSTCLGHRTRGGGQWAAVRVPRQRLGQRIIIPNKTKGYLGRRAACLRGTECHEAGRPKDRRPPIMCLVYMNELQRASVECVCVCERECITCQGREQEDKACVWAGKL